MITINKLATRLGDSAVLVALIAINVAVFVLIMAGMLAGSLGNTNVVNDVVEWLEVPDSMGGLAVRLWTLLTYMFVHVGVLHLLFNMLILYWFGGVFMNTGLSRQVWLLYIGGGIAGGLLYAAVGSLSSASGGFLAGSSASVLAIVAATAALHPDYRMNLFLFGEVSLKWVAVITIVLAMIGGGSVLAHVGGAAFGLVYAVALRRGRDLSALFVRRRRVVVATRRRATSRPAIRFNGRVGRTITDDASTPATLSPEQELDEILDKVRRSGYASLSLREKKKLIEVSRHIGRNDTAER